METALTDCCDECHSTALGIVFGAASNVPNPRSLAHLSLNLISTLLWSLLDSSNIPLGILLNSFLIIRKYRTEQAVRSFNGRPEGGVGS